MLWMRMPGDCSAVVVMLPEMAPCAWPADPPAPPRPPTATDTLTAPEADIDRELPPLPPPPPMLEMLIPGEN